MCGQIWATKGVKIEILVKVRKVSVTVNVSTVDLSCLE